MNRKEHLRWGILGAARINERLLPAIVASSNAELVAIASRRDGAAAETLARYAPNQSQVRAYGCLQALLDDAQVQAVYLPMANHEHAEWALQAIAKGKHVLCEKPMALRVSDIEAIELAAAKQNVTVMEGFMYRFHPQHARVRELLDSGLVGDIRSVRASFSFMMRPARMYRLAEPVVRGGGAMWDIGCYAVHCLRTCFNQEPLSVMALAETVASGADKACSGVFDFGQGRYGHFDVSFDRARRCEYEITGTTGGLKCHVVWQLPGDAPVISWWSEDGRQGEERLPEANHFCLEIEHFSQCVLAGQAPLLGLEDAKSNCRAMVAALQAAAGQRLIRLA